MISKSEREGVAAAFYWVGAGLIVIGTAMACGLPGALIAFGASLIVFTILNTR